MANFSLLDSSHPEIADLLAAMLQARAAVERRSWSHPRQPTGEDWWADVLTDPRARRQFRSRLRDLRTKPAFYRLRDEPHATVLVACSKCDWKAAFDRAALIVSHGPAHLLADLLGSELASPTRSKVGHHLDRCGAYFVEPSTKSKHEVKRMGAVISERLSDESTAINFRRRRCAAFVSGRGAGASL